ncbi:MAG: efflux RND transporter periplasmic adaptor subunit [Rikenellaceae bacterium]|nr:efflux RND transporter periplasmic adaptor subunit [Rikenellaceae bacterium]
MRYKNPKFLPAILALTGCLYLFCCTGCNRKQHAETSSGYRIAGDTVYIEAGGIMTSAIKTGRIERAEVSRTVEAAGTVRPIPTQYAFVAPPFAGRIVKSHISHGQTVARNAPLFEIISPDFTAVQKEFLQAQSDAEFARLDLRRKEDLLHNGVGSQKDYQEAANTMRIAEKELENATAALRIYNADPTRVVLGEPLVVRSPLYGRIIENNIVTGLYISEQAEPVAVVANLDAVWIAAQVKEKDIRFICEGDSIRIRVTAFPDDILKGTVFHIDEAVDEDTRSIKVLSVCDNRDEKLKLGMYATITFQPSAHNYTVIPEKAILQGTDSGFVYVKTEENRYVKAPVEVDFSSGGMAYVREWPYGDTEIIAEGGYFLI